MVSTTITSSRRTSRPMALPGHSGPLKYANAEDLPSYPSPGLKPGDAAASAAATLGWANTATPPTYAIARSGSLREQQSAVPRSHDAILAAGRSQRSPKPSSPPPSLWVSAAANLAFRGSQTPPPVAEAGAAGLSRANSMRAAKDAMSSARPRAWSSPQTPAEKRMEQSAGSAALSAASLAHRPSVRASADPVGDAGAVPFTTMDRQMFTSNPPVKPEIDEQNRAHVLHASALAMAKKMYDQQQRMIDHSAEAQARSSFSGGDTASLASSRDDEPPPLMYGSLQEAAYRLAQERLAKLQQEHDMQRGFQDYYGAGTAPRARFGSIKGKLSRKRSSSDGDLLEDKRRSEQIRKQMSSLSNKLSEVDDEKRMRDREALLAAAQRNVRAQLQQIDEKVQHDAGKVPQINMDDWGRKALVAAQAKSAAGNHETAGKVDIGGGKLMDRSEVDKIAAGKIKPLLDEINELAEQERQRLEAERLEEERRREKAELEKRREKEIQQIHKELKDQQREDERARKAEIKHQEKVRKEEAKALKVEQKHAAKEGKEKEEAAVPPATTSQPGADEPAPTSPQPEITRSFTTSHVRDLHKNLGKRHQRQKSKDTTDKPSSSDDPTSPTRKVRTWLLSRFPRQRAKSASATAAEDPNSTGPKKSFIGGIALARLRGTSHSSQPAAKLDKGKGKEVDDVTRPDSSLREVAMAGRSPMDGTTTGGTRGSEPDQQASHSAPASSSAFNNPTIIPSTPPQRPVSQVSNISQTSQPSIPASAVSARSVSSLSHDGSGNGGGGDEEVFVEARSGPEVIEPSPAPSSSTRNRDGGGGTGIALMTVTMTGRVSPVRESRFSEIL